MAERTDTHTVLDLIETEDPRPQPGVVVAFAEDRVASGTRAVTRRIRLGRDREIELHLDDVKASRYHAELEPAEDGVLVTDLASRNGTFVDGQRVSVPRTPARVGSSIRVGRSLLVVVADVKPHRREREPDPDLVGGPALDDVRQNIVTFGPSRVALLIEGETGTGKEIVAHLVHQKSGRAGELCSVNCAALPADLVESELFGHARGAFSSSDRARRGLFRTADGGTLVLDEVGDLPLEAQAKLLRALETGEVRSVGEDRPTLVDVRVLAATNRDLDQMVTAGSFRADLFHRIASCRISLPALRRHIEDIPMLAGRFAGQTGLAFSVHAMEKLMLHHWPGNVRELRNVIAAAVTRARACAASRVDVEHVLLPARGSGAGEDTVLEQRLLAAMASHSGNVSHVAAELGIRRATVYELLRKHGIDPARYRK